MYNNLKQIKAMREVATENARDLKNGAVEKNGFSGGIRSLELNSFQSGDIATIPQPGYKVLERRVRRNDLKSPTYEYVNVDVDRNGTKTVAALTPSLFWRVYFEADAEGNPTGQTVTVKGNVVDDVQNFATVDEFFAKNAGRKFKIEYGPQFLATGFSEGSSAVKRRQPTLTWVD